VSPLKKDKLSTAVIIFIFLIVITLIFLDGYDYLRLFLILAIGFFALGYAVNQIPIDVKKRKEEQEEELKPYQHKMDDLFDLQKELDDMKK
jgi:hypothetical protein